MHVMEKSAAWVYFAHSVKKKKNQRWEELHSVGQETHLLKCNLHSEQAMV